MTGGESRGEVSEEQQSYSDSLSEDELRPRRLYFEDYRMAYDLLRPEKHKHSSLRRYHPCQGQLALNRRMHSLPFMRILGKFGYRLAHEGITPVMQRGSYSSQCSPLPPEVDAKYAV